MATAIAGGSGDDVVMRPSSSSSTATRSRSSASKTQTRLRERMKDAGDTPGLLRGANRRSLLAAEPDPSAVAPAHDRDYLDHMRSISVTPVQRQQAKQDAAERHSLQSSASSSSSLTSAQHQHRHRSSRPSLSHSRPSVDSARSHQQHHQQHPRPSASSIHTHTSLRPTGLPASPSSRPTTTTKPRQRPQRPGSIASSSLHHHLHHPPPSITSSQHSATTTAASAEYNPLTYRPKDAVKVYRASQSLKPLPDWPDDQLMPPPMTAPAYHPVQPVSSSSIRSSASSIGSGSVRSSRPPPLTSLPPKASGSSSSRSRHVTTAAATPSPAASTPAGTNTPTAASVAWSDTDYHLENGELTDQSSSYIPTLREPERHRSSTHGPPMNSEMMEKNFNNFSRNWEKAKLDVRFGLFRTKQKLKRGISG